MAVDVTEAFRPKLLGRFGGGDRRALCLTGSRELIQESGNGLFEQIQASNRGEFIDGMTTAGLTQTAACVWDSKDLTE
jgi:hypothetical protein